MKKEAFQREEMKNEQQLTQVSQLKRPRQRMEKRFNSTNLNGDPKACVCQEVKTILMQFKVIEQVGAAEGQVTPALPLHAKGDRSL